MKKKVLLSSVATALILLSACNSTYTQEEKKKQEDNKTVIHANSTQEQLDKYKKLWEEQEIEDYAFVAHTLTALIPAEKKRVTVKKERLYSVQYVSNNQNVEDHEDEKIITEYFDFIQENISEEHEINVTYNTRYGYPQTITLNASQQSVDGSTTYNITQFRDQSENFMHPCTKEYVPVCASVQVDCVSTPCEPVEQTFSNNCVMENNSRASFLHAGECS